MSHRLRRQLSAVAALTLLLTLAACAEARDEPTEAVDAEDPEPAADDPAPAGSVEELLEAIAALDLSYEERLDYLYERAVEEGAVLVYGGVETDLLEAWSEGFQDAYPEINLLYVRQRGDELYERVLAEGRAQRHLVDLILGNPVVGTALYGEGLIAEHHGVPVPQGYAERHVGDWSVSALVNPHVITWNTTAITDEDAPREWDDFLRPEHSGCILDSGAHGFVAGMIADRGYEATEAWLQGFLDNGGVVVRGHAVSVRTVAAGEYDCAVYLYPFAVEGLRVDDGAPLEWHVPDPTPDGGAAAYIYRHTERPHAAALLMHWILDQDGADLTAEGGRIPAHPGVTLRYERFQPWVTEGSDLEQRLQDPVFDLEIDQQTLHLLETYLVPNLVRD